MKSETSMKSHVLASEHQPFQAGNTGSNPVGDTKKSVGYEGEWDPKQPQPAHSSSPRPHHGKSYLPAQLARVDAHLRERGLGFRFTLRFVSDALRMAETAVSARIRELNAVGWSIDNEAQGTGTGRVYVVRSIPAKTERPPRFMAKAARIAELEAEVRRLREELARERSRPMGQLNLLAGGALR